MTAYIIKKYTEQQWYDVFDGKERNSHRFFVVDIDDILLFLRQYNENFNQTLIEDSVIWDKEKEEITWTYYESWDDNRQYPEQDYLDIVEIKWIREI